MFYKYVLFVLLQILQFIFSHGEVFHSILRDRQPPLHLQALRELALTTAVIARANYQGNVYVNINRYITTSTIYFYCQSNWVFLTVFLGKNFPWLSKNIKFKLLSFHPSRHPKFAHFPGSYGPLNLSANYKQYLLGDLNSLSLFVFTKI